jgi:pSer/pThr/pTyr-binding forkhead associated (FHA) protein/class 3 adenylate cyclase
VPRWLPQFGRHKRRGRRGGSDPDAHPSAPERTLELLVIEGPDAGSRFTVEGGAIRIGRGVPQQGRADAIGLRDPSVSPHHATILANERECLIVHCAGAASPTLVNGRATSRAPIRAGDRIQIGRTMFEVRSRAGISLSGLLAIPDDLRAGLATAPARVDAATTEIRGALAPRAELVVLRGIRDREGQRLPLLARANRLGRHPSNEIVLPEQGVSRFHAEILWEGEELIFAHKSQVNPSYVNGERVDERVTLRGGEVIQLADRVALRIEIGEPAGAGAAGNAAEPSAPPSLRDLMEEKVRRDAEIERDFSFTGSFLDLDVVDSHGMKVTASRPEHIIVSFERFRGFASQVVQEHDGQVLNSNGDELMCFFAEPGQAVRAAAALLDRLAAFNARENLLARPFRVRQGIHSGSSLVDRVRGVAYSPVLDVAGHLQKWAPVDGLLVSAETIALLPPEMRFAPVGEVGKERVPAYRFEAFALDPGETATPPGEE